MRATNGITMSMHLALRRAQAPGERQERSPIGRRAEMWRRGTRRLEMPQHETPQQGGRRPRSASAPGAMSRPKMRVPRRRSNAVVAEQQPQDGHLSCGPTRLARRGACRRLLERVRGPGPTILKSAGRRRTGTQDRSRHDLRRRGRIGPARSRQTAGLHTPAPRRTGQTGRSRPKASRQDSAMRVAIRSGPSQRCVCRHYQSRHVPCRRRTTDPKPELGKIGDLKPELETPGGLRPRDPRPRDPKPRDPKPRDPKPRDLKPRDPKPRYPKPRDLKPSARKPGTLRIAGRKPRNREPRDRRPGQRMQGPIALDLGCRPDAQTQGKPPGRAAAVRGRAKAEAVRPSRVRARPTGPLAGGAAR